MAKKKYTEEAYRGILGYFSMWFDCFIGMHGMTRETSIGRYKGKAYAVQDIFNGLACSAEYMEKIMPAMAEATKCGVHPAVYMWELLPFLVDAGLAENKSEAQAGQQKQRAKT